MLMHHDNDTMKQEAICFFTIWIIRGKYNLSPLKTAIQPFIHTASKHENQ